MPDFDPSTPQDVAHAIDPADIIILSPNDQESLVQAILSPPAPAPALVRAFARRSKLLRTE